MREVGNPNKQMLDVVQLSSTSVPGVAASLVQHWCSKSWCNTGVANPATNKKQETRNNGNQRDRLDSGLVYLLHDSFVEVS